MSAPRLRITAWMVAGSWLVFGCSSSKKIDVGSTCVLNSDCGSSLVCTMGTCHDACHTSADCPTGQSCVKTSDAVVCQLPADISCSGTLTCGGGLSCAPDLHCRTGCLSVANCTSGQVCASNFCIDPGDPNLVNGQIARTGGVDAGSYDASSPDLSVAPPADAPATGGTSETGATSDALDAPAGPDVPASPVDVASSVDTGEAGRACTNRCDDGLFCTADTCVAGACQSTLNPGYCIIDKFCYKDGDTKSSDTCQACASSSSTALWTPVPEGARCGTGKSCQSQVCSACGAVGQACCGTTALGGCVEGAMCNANTKQCQADKAIDLSGSNDTFCALFQSGNVRCWGTNGAMLGASAGSNTAAPPIAGLQDAVSISVGSGTACAVRRAGSVTCWGSALAGGAQVPSISNATQVSAGPHTCVRTADSKVLCWGGNISGELGLGTTSTTTISTPQEMLGVSDAQSVAACGRATCVLRKGGQVSCTGSRGENGQATATSTLTDLVAGSIAVSLSCSSYGGGSVGSFWAVTQNATVLAWGYDQAPGNALGLGQVLTATRATDGSKSSYLAVQTDNTLWSVGDNTWGQLGDGTFTSATTHTIPKLIHNPSTVDSVVAVGAAWPNSGSATATCLLRNNGGISCAGHAGQNGTSSATALGDGQQYPQAPRAYFVPVVGILPVASEDGQCYDGVDNDGDGKADLDDSDCAQDLGSAVGPSIATVSFRGVFGNYLKESCYAASGPEAVLTWTAPSGGTYQFDTSGSTFDTVLVAYKGNPMTSAELACNDDATLPSDASGSVASAIKVQVVTGDKLTLVVDSKGAPNGPASFTLNITKQ
jgi:hypothetical protein